MKLNRSLSEPGWSNIPNGPPTRSVAAKEKIGMVRESDVTSFPTIDDHDETTENARDPFPITTAKTMLPGDEMTANQPPVQAIPDGEAGKSPDISQEPEQYQAIYKETRSWGLALLVLGVLHIIMSGLFDASWGVILIIIGLASFYFRSAAVFIVYSFTLGWASVSNAFSGSGAWIAFSVLQAFLAFKTFRKFLSFRQLEFKLATVGDQQTIDSEVVKDRSATSFPWISLVLGLTSIFGLFAVIIVMVVLAVITGEDEVSAFFIFVGSTITNLAVLGLATGVASLLMRYRYKAASIIGLVAGAIYLLIEVGLLLLEKIA